MKKLIATAVFALAAAAASAEQPDNFGKNRVEPQPAHGEIPSLQTVNQNYISHRNDDRIKLIYTGGQTRSGMPVPQRTGSDKYS